MTPERTFTRRAALGILGGVSLSLLAACQQAAPAPTTVPAAPNATSAPVTAPTQPVAAATQPVAPTQPVAAATQRLAATQPVPATQPRSGGTLRLGQISDIVSLDGHFQTSGLLNNVWQVFDRLTSYDEKLQPQPMLAESWDVTPDLKQVTFHLRKGVQFHTGREMTSDDVKYNILRPSKIPTLGNLTTWSKWWSSVETPDKYTVVARSDVSRPAMFDFFEYLNIIDSQTMEGPDAKTKAVGTGPFKFVEWQPGALVRFAKNPNYWQSGRPYLDEFITSVIRDPQAMLVQLEAGQIDLVDALPLPSVAQIQQDAKYKVTANANSGNVSVMLLNLSVRPLDNKMFRQALQYALDRKRISQTAHVGTAQPRLLPWAPNSVAYDADKNSTYAFDLDKAAALLKQSGVTSPTFELSYNATSPQFATYAQIYQADLQKIGINAPIMPMDSAVWLDAANNSKWQGITIGRASTTQLDPSAILVSAYFDPTVGQTTFRSEAYTAAVNAAIVETDKAKQKALHGRVNDILLDEAFALAVSSNPGVTAASTKVQGVRYDQHETLVLNDIWLGS